MIVLGIETSCDETGVAIYDDKSGLLFHKLYSQAKLHSVFGGVVPELASRDHVRKLLPLVEEVLFVAKIFLKDIDCIAYTAGPGLVGALMVGAAFAKTISFVLKIPSIPVNHLEAHILSPFLDPNPPKFPFLALLVSGGHTQLIDAIALGKYEVLGETLDDAVGEAFDKVAKILGIPYPGGAELAKLAERGESKRFNFPRPMIKRGLSFSFSGLKTCVLLTYRKSERDSQTKFDIACAFQEAVTDSLVIKCRRAIKKTKRTDLVVAGGVSANAILRNKICNMAKNEGVSVYFPRLEFCTDNGAMIAYTGAQYFPFCKGVDKEIKVYPRWRI